MIDAFFTLFAAMCLILFLIKLFDTGPGMSSY